MRSPAKGAWLPALLLLPGTLGAAPEPELSAEAPVTAVTVYSDRARVTRSGRVQLHGAQRVRLPLLLPGIDPASVRVEARGAEVQRVEMQRVEASEMPTTAARALLERLERLDDQIARVRGEEGAYRAQGELLGRLQPVVPVSEPQRAVPRLSAGGWERALGFLRGAQERAQEQLRGAGEQLRLLGRQRQDLSEQVSRLGILEPRAGYRVVSTLRGEGPVELTLTYLVAPARWLPTYDIQLAAETNQVELRFLGRVSQETGEDWGDASLVLSTAVPATATQIPRLATWKIGERERFLPTPVAARPAPPPPPSAPALPPREPDEDARLRQRLQRHLAQGGEGERSRRAEPRPADADRDEGLVRLDAPKSPPPAPPPPPPVLPMEVADARVVKEEVARVPVSRTFESVLASAPGSAAGSAPPVPVESVGLLPGPGYRAPRYDGHLPAALAGGHDLSYPTVQRETVRSGQGVRNVALFSRRIPVNVVRKVYPALAQEAFLVAELRNQDAHPLPGGAANLFVGADPAGVAQLNLVAPGEVFTLPLGLDRAVRPQRNVRLLTSEKGVFSKDEISEYQVTTELVNPHRAAITVKLYDQIPLAGDKNVEIKLTHSDPVAAVDAHKGALEWRLVVPPGGKAQTRFTYTLRRPKGYRLYQ